MNNDFMSRRSSQLDQSSGQLDNGSFVPNLTPDYLTDNERALYPEKSTRELAREAFSRLSADEVEKAAKTFNEDPAVIATELTSKFQQETNSKDLAIVPPHSDMVAILEANKAKIEIITQSDNKDIFENSLNYASRIYGQTIWQSSTPERTKDLQNQLNILQQIIDHCAAPDGSTAVDGDPEENPGNVINIFGKKSK